MKIDVVFEITEIQIKFKYARLYLTPINLAANNTVEVNIRPEEADHFRVGQRFTFVLESDL